MAIPSNRSPTPVSTRPIPNSRTSENINSNSYIRRSFNGNPLPKPSFITNPTDLGSRQFVGKEGPMSMREEKENDKDQNMNGLKARSPAKATKNFMSPTISAASKFTPSPKKKILMESNEPVRTSISFSSAKGLFHSKNLSEVTETPDLMSSEPGLDSDRIKEAVRLNTESSCLEVPLNSNNVSESLSEKITVNSDCVNADSCSKTKPFSSPIIAPLDADPSLPPYDPKINYLSPRPQFLHYKPNPRIELHLNKKKVLGIGETKGLEDSSLSEIFSDSELTEESQSEDLQNESQEASLSEDSPKESEEEASLPEIMSEEEVESHVPDQLKSTTLNCTEMSKGGTVEMRKGPKLWVFSRSKCISLLLIFLIACVSMSVTDSPVIDKSVLKDLSFSKLYEPSGAIFIKENFDGFYKNLKQWSANSASYLSKLIPSFGESTRLGPMKFHNLSALQEDTFLDHNVKRVEEIYEQNVYEAVRQGGVELKVLDEEDYSEDDEGQDYSEIQKVEMELLEEASEGKDYSELEAELNELDNTGVVLEQEHSDTTAEPERDINLEEKAAPISLGESEDNGLSSSVKTESIIVDTSLKSPSAMHPSVKDFQSPEAINSTFCKSEAKFSGHGMLRIFLILLALAAATAFIYMKKLKARISDDVVNVDPFLTKKHRYQNSPNWQTEVVNVAGESSCPSELSSYHKNSSYSKRLVMGGAYEAQSHEGKQPRKNYKRESLASSSSDYSMGSLSYGSFTTYEKISKHASGEEEIVTPVRRSSRIRNHQVTSP